MSKHLTLDDRYEIYSGLNEGRSICSISRDLKKHPSTITNEIRKHYISMRSGGYGRAFNDCLLRYSCKKRNDTRTATPCYLICKEYQKEVCPSLNSVPYVCNGCKKRNTCEFEKRWYKPKEADQAYQVMLRETRSGFSISLSHVQQIDEIASPLIKQGQSIHHLFIHHEDELMVSEKTLYSIVHAGLISAKPLDCPRIVRFKPRKVTRKVHVDKKCRDGRTYQDFLNFIKLHPDCSVVEMDTLEGSKGGKVMLTLYFPQVSLLLGFLRDHNDSASVTHHLNTLEKLVGRKDYCTLFSILLCDNGPEFSNPNAIEIPVGSCIEEPTLFSKLFYCDGGRPDQKGGIENSHTLIRRILPKGTSFDHLNQTDVDLLLSHINSYSRKKLNDHSPLDMFSFLFSSQLIEKFNLVKIDPDQINLTPSCLK